MNRMRCMKKLGIVVGSVAMVVMSVGCSAFTAQNELDDAREEIRVLNGLLRTKRDVSSSLSTQVDAQKRKITRGAAYPALLRATHDTSSANGFDWQMSI